MKELIKQAVQDGVIEFGAALENNEIVAFIGEKELWLYVDEDYVVTDENVKEYVAVHIDGITETIYNEWDQARLTDPDSHRYTRDYLLEHSLPGMDDTQALEAIREAYGIQLPKKYHFKISIGDWSGDYHCVEQYYLVISNKPVEAVREAHFAMESVTGINIENLCCSYGEDTIDLETTGKLQQMGYEFSDVVIQDGMNCAVMTPKEMADLWLFLLMKTDPELKLELQTLPEAIPSLQFYGFDDDGRHIGSVGYGLFHKD